jgi:hypothetical protein
MDQLVAYLDGRLAALVEEFERREGDTAGLSFYRIHAAKQLAAWSREAAERARRAIASGSPTEALAAIDQLELAVRQLLRIARQEGPVPDYKGTDANPVLP